MPKSDSEWQREAAEMAARIDRQRQAGEQLALLPDEVADEGDEARGVGRPKGAKNKGTSQMRDYLAARGLRMPEDVLTEIAGLTTQDDVISLAMRQTERVLSWAFDGAHIGEKAAPKATSAMRLDVFRQQYTMILRATEALMPYMAPKATPDQVVNQNVQVVVSSGPTGAADPAATARDVTPKAPRRTGRMMPADAAHERQQNQQVSGSTGDGSDGTGRTE